MNKRPQFSVKKSLILIFTVAFVLRFVGIWYGLPSLYNSDEPKIVGYALSFGARRSLEPIFVEYPSLYFYFLFAIYGLYFLVGILSGIFNSVLDLAASYFLNPTGLFLVGRFVSVLLGSLTVLVVFYTGQRFFSRNVGLLASLILALSFTHVSRSHWILLEAMLGLFCASALYLIL
ncbi:MAG: phospholipid carrier-dependent glycosyltransferase, partial [bacterium]